MKVANLFFTLSLSAYFTVGRYDSLIWSDFYYTVFVGYTFCCLLIDKKLSEDKVTGLVAAGGIWALYLIRPFFSHSIFYEWIRFVFGCLIGILGMFYLVYILTKKTL